MAKSLRQEIINWVEERGGVAWRMTAGVGGAYFQFGESDEALSIVHFVVGIGHTSAFTDARLLLIRAYGYMAGRIDTFEEFMRLVNEFEETGRTTRCKRKTDC